MGFLDKVKDTVKNAIVDEVPDEKPNKAAPSPLKAPLGTGSFDGTTTTFHAVQEKVDPKALEKLENAVKASVPPAYNSFIEQFDNLADTLPNETTRIKVAIKASHSTPDGIVGALDQMLGSLEQKRNEFQKSAQENLEKTQSKHAEQTKSITDLIEARKAQVQSVEAEIISLQSRLDAAKSEYDSEQLHIQSVSAGFEGAYKQVSGKLVERKNRINSIKG